RMESSGFWRRTPAFTPSKIHVEYSGQAITPDTAVRGLSSQRTPSPEPTSRPLTTTSQSPPSDHLSPLSIQSPLSAQSPHKPADPTHEKFHMALGAATIDLALLQKLSWTGIPREYRAITWQLLMGYLPLASTRRAGTLQRKRKEYGDWVRQTFARGEDALDRVLWRQIQVDVPRTSPGSPVFQNPRVQRCLERILYAWAARHPASGYVQGINDLLTPFVYVFLEAECNGDTTALDRADLDAIDDAQMDGVEADSFWSLSKLLDGIQDNYTHAQPGIQRQIVKLKDLVTRVDHTLAAHLQSEGVEFVQFAFRWINCLLMRELRLASIIRMWDTYLAEPNGFAMFHIYVCAAMLLKWSAQLRAMDFQQIMLFLQQPPALQWATEDVELLLSEAYMLKCLYHDAPRHLHKN
ncbi:GTPase-activating protein, partial [Coemansia sp. RSA 788]